MQRISRWILFLTAASVAALHSVAEDLPPLPEAGEDPFIVHCRWSIAADFKRTGFRFPYAEKSKDGTTVEVIFDRKPARDQIDLGVATCTYPAPPSLESYDSHRFAMDGKPFSNSDNALATKSAITSLMLARIGAWKDTGWVEEPKYVEQERQRRLKETAERSADEVEYSAARLLTLARQRQAAGDAAQAVRLAELLIKRHANAPEAAEAREIAGALASTATRQESELRARLEKAVSRLEKQEDPVDRLAFYYAPGFPVLTRANGVILYIGHDPRAGRTSLRLRINYAGDDWLFLRSFTIVADEERFDIDASGVKRDHAGGKVWEWFDVTADKEVWEKVSSAKNATIRLRGDKYHLDREITKRQKEGFRAILDGYRVLREER